MKKILFQIPSLPSGEFHTIQCRSNDVTTAWLLAQHNALVDSRENELQISSPLLLASVGRNKMLKQMQKREEGGWEHEKALRDFPVYYLCVASCHNPAT